jgi:hypothetical protein
MTVTVFAPEAAPMGWTEMSGFIIGPYPLLPPPIMVFEQVLSIPVLVLFLVDLPDSQLPGSNPNDEVSRAIMVQMEQS